jgi:hypothetical protein
MTVITTNCDSCHLNWTDILAPSNMIITVYKTGLLANEYH